VTPAWSGALVEGDVFDAVEARRIEQPVHLGGVFVEGDRPSASQAVSSAADHIARHPLAAAGIVSKVEQGERLGDLDLDIATASQLCFIHDQVADHGVPLIPQDCFDEANLECLAEVRAPKRFFATRRRGSLNRLPFLP